MLGQGVADDLAQGVRSRGDIDEAAGQFRQFGGYREQREFDEIPGRIEALETEQKRMGAMLSDPELYRTDPQQIAMAQTRFDAIDEELLSVMERWEALGKR